METWRDVVGYEGLYEVSDLGRVRSAYTKRILSPGISQGYYYVALYKNGVRSNKQVNRLVAEAFLPNDNDYPIVHHKDEVRTNNALDNLEWQSYSYNNTYNGVAIRRGEQRRGRPSPLKGTKRTQEFRQKVSDGMKEYYRRRKLSDDTI